MKHTPLLNKIIFGQYRIWLNLSGEGFNYSACPEIYRKIAQRVKQPAECHIKSDQFWLKRSAAGAEYIHTSLLRLCVRLVRHINSSQEV